jgi:hypothetical protein
MKKTKLVKLTSTEELIYDIIRLLYIVTPHKKVCEEMVDRLADIAKKRVKLTIR